KSRFSVPNLLMNSLLSLTSFSLRLPESMAFCISSLSSSIEPMHSSWLPSSVRQIGSGVPQYLERERFQSTRFSNQFPNLPVPVDSGFQLIVLFSATSLSFTAVVLMNQLSKG